MVKKCQITSPIFATTEKNSVAEVSAMAGLAKTAIARAISDARIMAIDTISKRTDLLSALNQAIPSSRLPPG